MDFIDQTLYNRRRRHNMKKNITKLFVLLIAVMAIVSMVRPILSTPSENTSETPQTELPENTEPETDETAVTTGIAEIKKHGNLVLETKGSEFFEKGYEYGDMIKVSVLGKEYEMPVCHGYTEVEEGQCVCVIAVDEASETDTAVIAVNSGNFAEYAGIAFKEKTEEEPGYQWNYAEGVELPVQIDVSIQEKGAYAEKLSEKQLVRTNERNDYTELSDEDYANFREVSMGSLKEHILYRSSSPINPDLNRNHEADEACKAAGIRSFINLADSAVSAAAFEGYNDTYYAMQDIFFADMSYDFTSAESGEKIANAMRFISETEGPYLIHCKEGKDRTGFVIAVIECLAGASWQEIKEDYLKTYINFFKIETSDPLYERIAEINIRKSLEKAFSAENIETADLEKCAEEYLHSISLSDDEIASLKKALLK